MAEVSYLHLRGEDDDVDNEDDRDSVVVTLDSAPFWSHDFEGFDVYTSDLDFPSSEFQISTHPHREVLDPDSSNFDLFHRENQVNFVMDMLHQRVERSSSDTNFGVIEGNDELGLNNFELDLGLGLGFSVESHNNNTDDNSSGFIVADCGDEFFVSRRGSSALSESDESSNMGDPDFFMGGLRVVDIESDIEDRVNEGLEDFGLTNDDGNDDGSSSLQNRLNSFQLEDGRDLNNNEEFEWEEIDGRIDEREVLSMAFEAEADDDASVVAIREEAEEVDNVERNRTFANLEWEVLLNIHNLEANHGFGHEEGDDGYFDHDEYTTAEYEMLFGQFAENENASIGRPPASKAVIDNLNSVVLTTEDVENNNALCAVCKDDINVGERVKQLPCSHRYHGDCILPWLGIRNTCPVCRYELPTDDPDYERRRSIRAAQRH